MVTARSLALDAVAAVRERMGRGVAAAVALSAFALFVRQSLPLPDAPARPAAEFAAAIAIGLATLLAMIGLAAVSGARKDAPAPGIAVALAASIPALAKLVAAGAVLGLAGVAAAAAVMVPVTLLAARLLPDEAMPGVAAAAAILFVAMAGAACLWATARFGALPGVYLFERAPLGAGLVRAWILARGAAGPGLLLVPISVLAVTLAAAPLSLAAIPGFLLAPCYGAALGVYYRQLADAAPGAAAGAGREQQQPRAAFA